MLTMCLPLSTHIRLICTFFKVISQLIHWPDDQPSDVNGFLRAHLVNDVQNTSASLERSVDEVLLMIHRVLAQIVDRATTRKSIHIKLPQIERRSNEETNYFIKVPFSDGKPCELCSSGKS